jgi:hypothetical protein
VRAARRECNRRLGGCAAVRIGAVVLAQEFRSVHCLIWLSKRNYVVDAIAREHLARLLCVHLISCGLRFAGGGEDCTWIILQDSIQDAM